MFKRKNPFIEKDSMHSLYESNQDSAPMHSMASSSYPDLPGTNYAKTQEDLFPQVHEVSSANLQDPAKQTTSFDESQDNPLWDHNPATNFQAPRPLESEQPETTLGKEVVFKGTLNFKRLLRIDGSFEGELVSEGKLVVGPSGTVKSNVNLQEAIVEGFVEGNINVSGRLEVRADAYIKGNITAKLLSVDEGARIEGNIQISGEKDQDIHEEDEQSPSSAMNQEAIASR